MRDARDLAMRTSTPSPWVEASEIPSPTLQGDHEVDVGVSGAGITGLTTAHVLARSNLKVALLEGRTIGSGETEKTTAHLTELVDTRYHTLISRFGRAGAQLVAWAQHLAIDSISTLVEQWSVPADFARVTGYLYAETDEQVEDLRKELEACQGFGLTASWTDDCPLPFATKGALKIEKQARFNPTPYLHALARAFVADGGLLFQHSPVTAVEDGSPCEVKTAQGTVRARSVVLATHVPIRNRVLLQTKLAAYRTYAIAAPLVRQGVASGTFWDMHTPYHYIRSHVIDGRAHLIVGGEDHRVGSTEGEEPQAFERLEKYVKEKFAGRVLEPTHRWSGQILESVDGLPFVGKDAAAEHVFVASGYAGNGITWGTLAGFVLADLIRNIESPWQELLDATRIKPLAGAKAFLTENVAFPQHYLLDRLKSAKTEEALPSLPAGQGDVFKIRGERMAVYKDAQGQLSACSAVCPHLGCLVHWNTSEGSWDCPCHGSRFDPRGAVLNGPALTPLAPKALVKG